MLDAATIPLGKIKHRQEVPKVRGLAEAALLEHQLNHSPGQDVFTYTLPDGSKHTIRLPESGAASIVDEYINSDGRVLKVELGATPGNDKVTLETTIEPRPGKGIVLKECFTGQEESTLTLTPSPFKGIIGKMRELAENPSDFQSTGFPDQLNVLWNIH